MPGTLLGAALLGVLATVPAALLPLAVGYAVDAITAPEAWPGLVGWVGAILGLGAAQAVGVALTEYVGARAWLSAALCTQQAVLGHAAEVGAELPRLVRTGEVIAVGASDVHQIGHLFEIVGRAAGALVAAAVAAILVLRTSPLLGVVVLVGVPLATAGLVPLLGPLRRRTEAHREQVASVTSMAADIVSGLRVLRGIGGERPFAERFAQASHRVHRAGVDADRVDAGLAGIAVLLTGLVTVLVTWLGARLALTGQISAGQLVACYGVAAFLVVPVGVAGEAAHVVSEALVAAGRAVAVLRLRPALTDPAHPMSLPTGPLGLADGPLVCPPGRLTVIVPDGPVKRVADRLGRFVDSGVRALGPNGEEVRLDAAALPEVRRRILVAHHQDVLFSGPLAEGLTPDDEPGRTGRGTPDLDTLLWAADAADVVDGLPAGTAEPLTEQGRRLSGGQRQRLLLARALGVDPDVLVLDEPTSAVDAHTEARIAERVARLRRGRTTVVITHSPLWAAAADQVSVSGGIDSAGRAVAVGDHVEDARRPVPEPEEAR